jgi:CelD/BcsL family acetyltransferase involved in cellulose biosynthesis
MRNPTVVGERRLDGVRTRILSGFDDPVFGREAWNGLLERSGSDSIYLTWEFQRAWWETLGRGELLLILAERGGRPVALAPFYCESGMVYFVGSAFESDYLGFVGDVAAPAVLDALLEAARRSAPGFLGFELYFLPDRSGAGEQLRQAARRLGLSCYEEEEMTAPALDLAGRPDLALAAAHRPKLAKLERAYRREGCLVVQHLREATEIRPHLDEFVEQHIARWSGTENPSRFLYPKARRLIERFTELAAPTGWLRFTRLEWQGRAIAFHYGYCHRGRYYWGIPSFAVDLARRSPGQLLLRQLLLAAIEEGARCFDFGTGAQEFKMRFASQVDRVRTWGLYLSSPVPPGGAESPAADALALAERGA